MIKVANRSPESWGPLASLSDNKFNQLINTRKLSTKNLIKDEIKKINKTKTYKVTFVKEFHTDPVELQAESDWDIGNVARSYFQKNESSFEFKERETSPWADGYTGYTSIRYFQVKKTISRY